MTISPPARPDSPFTPAELLSLIGTFNAELLSHSSATAALERWCAVRGLAREAKIAALLDRGAERPLDEGGLALLALEAGESVRHRHVRLFCGDKLLSEADNWYVPDRLTAKMNRLLDETETPFGRAIRDLNFRRDTLFTRLLWPPLPGHLHECAPAPQGDPEPAARILEHRALLRTEAGKPLALVAETYTSEVLGFTLQA